MESLIDTRRNAWTGGMAAGRRETSGRGPGRTGRLHDERPIGADEVFALCRPALEFSGDLWLHGRDEGGLWLALGDVAGKGLDAAVWTAVVTEELEHRLAAPGCPLLPELAAALNAVLVRQMPANRFVSLVLGRLRDDGELRLVNAGHGPVWVRRWDGRVVSIGSTGPVLGLLADAELRETCLHLAPGESVVVVSDGVLEAGAPDGRELGPAPLAGALARAPAHDAAGIAGALMAELEGHLDGLPAGDDVTLLVVRRSEKGSAWHRPAGCRSPSAAAAKLKSSRRGGSRCRRSGYDLHKGADMPTTLNDDEALERTNTESTDEALCESARRSRLRRLLDFEGGFSWEGNLDELRGRGALHD